jgi:transposase
MWISFWGPIQPDATFVPSQYCPPTQTAGTIHPAKENGMTNVTQLTRPRVITGIDTHKDFHVAVAIDLAGRRLGQLVFPTSVIGYRSLETWALTFGEIEAFGIEGTGSFGAGLTRYLQRCHRVVEVCRPDRALRRQLGGKTDFVDAESAARSVLAGTATATPKSRDTSVEVIRLLRVARKGAVKAKTQAATTLQSMSVALPDELREKLRGESTINMVRICVRWQASPRDDVQTAGSKAAFQSIANRYETLEKEIKALDKQLAALVQQVAPKLTELFGVGTHAAASILVTVGDNPERMKSEASLASLCGVSPVHASSGRTIRHRLNRGGDREANSAIYMIVLIRLRRHEETRRYVERRTAEGPSKREIIRCLKRYVVREVFGVLLPSGRE